MEMRLPTNWITGILMRPVTMENILNLLPKLDEAQRIAIIQALSPMREDILNSRNQLIKERDAAIAAKEALAHEHEAALSELHDAKLKLSTVCTETEGVWFWQRGGDEPQSLACPVVMDAETLRGIIAAEEVAKEERQLIGDAGKALTAERDRLSAELTELYKERNHWKACFVQEEERVHEKQKAYTALYEEHQMLRARLRDVAERQRAVDCDFLWHLGLSATARELGGRPIVTGMDRQKMNSVCLLGWYGVSQRMYPGKEAAIIDAIAAWPVENDESWCMSDYCGSQCFPGLKRCWEHRHELDPYNRGIAEKIAVAPGGKDTGQPLCKHCGKDISKHHGGGANPRYCGPLTSSTYAASFEPAPPQPDGPLDYAHVEGKNVGTIKATYRNEGRLPARKIEPQPAASGALDEFTDDACDWWLGREDAPQIADDMARGIKRRNARIAELTGERDRHLQGILNGTKLVNETVVENDRLRAKCARQRRELRRLNEYARLTHKSQYQTYCERNEARKERDAALKELRALKEREAPEDAWDRAWQSGWRVARRLGGLEPADRASNVYNPPRKEGSE